ncbi:MAG: phosphoribosylformylglycinamidine synthase I [Gammaproteobacteria bacterium]|nr:phosphoribosylformylglycinamidine synthase I [Gammaproteobacteria bacterium]
MTVKIAVIQFPGSNCEREAIMAVKRVGMEAEAFLWNRPSNELADYDGYIIVGGFSYEDRARAGIIAALDPIMPLLKVQSELGKPLLGICNGAQILVETGLIPGAENDLVAMALAENHRISETGQVLGTGYYNCWTPLKRPAQAKRNAFNRFVNSETIITAPIAHAEGRFLLPAPLLTQLIEGGQIAWQYCSAEGEIEDRFPINPNGSMANIAAMTNPAGNVMAMMPHPERTSGCDAIFASMRDYILEGNCTQPEPIVWKAPTYEITTYQPQQSGLTLVVDTIITDNHAVSVEQALRGRGLDVKVSRRIHWEVVTDCAEQVEAPLLASGELFNPNKERVVSTDRPANSYALLVRSRDNIFGKKRHQALQHHFTIDGIKAIKQGVLWYIESASAADLEQDIAAILQSQILFNPYAHDCYTL